ncbi:YlaH-like family protein [Lederbergia lenta]|uniref:YlaH n=2 Tax=Lederbergia lenta TaxID=1467 RepID=A0A2X4WBL4_LEDLE|nr:YlaH-like family protein [Lederbergia lenta]MCM3110286.1 YlaH-like family protein [Lederbergia lenta]MEC2324146.1 YlaH-like family protein [Lederbergia lenta]SQI60551.1 YlaH [Lederbergia lenta]
MMNNMFVLALTSADQRAIDKFSPTLRFFYNLTNSPALANWLLWITLTGLAVLVYKLGFAKKLPLGKSIVIYLFLIIGCLFLTFLAIFLPIAEGLMVAALILIIYKVRLNREKKAGRI